MRIVITGGNGMLGRTLQRRLSGHELFVADLPQVDITNLSSISGAVEQAKAEVVIHCAAMTAVDRCETEADLAYKINSVGSANVAIACQRAGARLIALSTDYVFAGDLSRPYHEWDATGPRTVYGASKLAGEEAIRAHCPDHAILRIAWLYGPGGPSFLHTMLKLAAEAGAPLKVVNDQVGNPTSTDAVADRIAEFIDLPLAGTLHLTCEGEASWFDFAREIFAQRPGKRNLLPCATAEYPRPAPRPANSRLEKRALRLHGLKPMPDWRETLRRYVREHAS
ncbi:MAG TPA: dTDP-4-dehydrorhamnose reductase [Planctomycetota bacterium]|jgi:dTDP-4-dehydrorhamnose reductase